jgi:hypothetical protein
MRRSLTGQNSDDTDAVLTDKTTFWWNRAYYSGYIYDSLQECNILQKQSKGAGTVTLRTHLITCVTYEDICHEAENSSVHTLTSIWRPQRKVTRTASSGDNIRTYHDHRPKHRVACLTKLHTLYVLYKPGVYKKSQEKWCPIISLIRSTNTSETCYSY